MRLHPTSRTQRVLLATTGAIVLALVTAPSASAAGRISIQMKDRCDPVTFNAAIGPGTCVAHPLGNVTFARFLDKLNPKDGGHEAWTFSPDEAEIVRGTSLHVTNTGGETHSFTEVANFGAGVVPPLNAALPPGTPPARPIGNPGPTFVGPGGTIDVSGLKPGKHKFECLIHPWMRAVVEVEGRG